MKRTFISDFLVKLALVFIFAFFISFVISYLYFSNLILKQHMESLKRVAHFLIKEKLSGYTQERSKKADLAGMLKQQPATLQMSFNADFVLVFNTNGVAEASTGFYSENLLKERYIQEVIKLKKEVQFIHKVPDKFFKDQSKRGGKERLLFSIFTPITTNGGTKFIWFGYFLDNMVSSIFKDLPYLGVDKGFIFTGEDLIGVSLDEAKKAELVKSLVGSKEEVKFDEKGVKYIAIKVPFYDYKSEAVGYIVVAKRYDLVKQVLDRYLFSMLLIFCFSSLVGLIFVCLYFRKIFLFFKGFIEALNRVKENDFSTKLEDNYNIKEFSYISKEFNSMSEQLNFYINKMSDEINIRVKEIIELNRAIRILDKQHNYDMLVETAKNFLKKNLGFGVVSLDECLNRLSCGECNFRLIAYQAENNKVGFCIEKNTNKFGFQEEFLQLFEEVFKINCERIHNIKKKEEGFAEATLLSDILISLLKKRSVQEIFTYILEKAREFCNSDASFIGIYDAKEGKIHLKFFQNINTEEFKKLSFPSDTGLGGLVLREKRGVFIENYFDDPRIVFPFTDVVKKEGLVSNIAVPIFFKGDVYGILYVSYRTPKKVLGREIAFLEKLANAASLAIEKEMLISETKRKEDELRKAYEEIVARRKEINDILKSYKEANIELEKTNRELTEQYDVIKKSYDELNRLNKAKDTFLGILSHELKTPVTILRGYLDTLLSDRFVLQEDVKSILLSAKKSLLSLTNMIEDILDYARVEMGKVVIKKMPYSLQNILNLIYPEVESHLKERNQMLELEIKGDVIVETDGRWFKKAMLNLINNAIKFTPDGRKIRVTAFMQNKSDTVLPPYVLEKLPNSEVYTVIKVSDEGVGIDYDDLNNVFDKFYESGDIKTHSSGTYKFLSKGLGMGLSLVKQIVKLHNGIIYVESPGYDPKVCPGSVFTIILPVGYDKLEREETSLTKKKILVVENENEIIKFLELVFSKDYETHFATDGAAGYKKVLEIKPDLVFINVNVPKHDGYELCSMIKEDKNIRKIPVILYVSGSDTIDEMRATCAMANMVFSPIFDIDNLKRIALFYLKKEVS